MKIQTATAEGIRLINAAAPGEGVIAIKSIEAMKEIADGKATKLIIPSDMQSLAGLAASVKEFIKE